MKLHQLRDFVTVSEMGSVHAAARKLGITQPAVSKSIRQLEAELGMPLFDRSAKGAVLNAFGRAFLARAQLAVHELQRGKDQLTLMSGQEATGTVAFSVFGSPALVLVPGALAYFRQRFPNAQVRIVEGSGAVARSGLNDGSLDFSLLPLPFEDPGGDFVVQHLYANHRVVVARKGHPLESATSLSQLTGAEWVTTGATGTREAEFELPFERHGLAVPKAPTRCESLIALLALLVGSDLITFLPPQWVEAPATRGVLSHIRVRESITGPSLGLVRRKGLPLTTLSEFMGSAIAREVLHYAGDEARELRAFAPSA
ncbi:MAG: LysR family transcriptional regulator [Burkholderiaceae bacterium]